MTSKEQLEQDFDSKVFDFIDKLKAEYSLVQQEWQDIKSDLIKNAIASGVVVGLSAGATFILGNITIGAISGFGAGIIKDQFVEGYSTISEKMKETSKQPLFVFLELEGK